MWYLDKKGILEHCGKDGKDVRWLDRAMKRGEVIHDVDMGYITVVDYIGELEEEIKRLKSEPKQVVESDSGEVQKLMEELEEAKVNCDYWEKKCYRYADYMNQVIDITYDRIKPMLGNKLESKEDFREHILSEVKEIKE